MKKLMMILTGLALTGGAGYGLWQEVGWWMLAAMSVLLFLLWTVGAFAAGILTGRALLVEGAGIAAKKTSSESQTVAAFAGVLNTGLKYRQQAAPTRFDAPLPMLPPVNGSGFTIEGLDQPYDPFPADEA